MNKTVEQMLKYSKYSKMFESLPEIRIPLSPYIRQAHGLSACFHPSIQHNDSDRPWSYARHSIFFWKNTTSQILGKRALITFLLTNPWMNHNCFSVSDFSRAQL